MVVDRIRRGSPAPKSSCRRHHMISVAKADAKRAGNLRRRRIELRKMRSVAKENTYGDDPSGSSDSDEHMKRKCLNNRHSSDDGSNNGDTYNNDVIEDDEEVPVKDQVSDTKSSADGGLHGTISVVGRRRKMEDALAVELGFLQKGEKSYDFYGVYDGHGGWRVAEECGEKLHKVVRRILEEEENNSGVVNWEKTMAEGFRMMDVEVNRNGKEVAMTGSTAVVAVVGKEEVVVANCGDSRAVLARGGMAVQLSDDHKPDRPDELRRIEISGGKVINWNGQRVLGVLSTSRSIGDNYLKPFVITDPEVRVIKRTDSDEFLILASDGLWDVVSNDMACQATRMCRDGLLKSSYILRDDVESAEQKEQTDEQKEESSNSGYAYEAAAVLAELAMNRGSTDNISVIVVELQPTSPS